MFSINSQLRPNYVDRLLVMPLCYKPREGFILELLLGNKYISATPPYCIVFTFTLDGIVTS